MKVITKLLDRLCPTDPKWATDTVSDQFGIPLGVPEDPPDPDPAMEQDRVITKDYSIGVIRKAAAAPTLIDRLCPVDPRWGGADTVSGHVITEAARQAKAATLIDISLPNVWTFVVITDRSQFVLYRSTPGDTRPRLAMVDDDGNRFDCGDVVAPDRFGPVGTTKAEFANWCERFATYVSEDQS